MADIDFNNLSDYDLIIYCIEKNIKYLDNRNIPYTRNIIIANIILSRELDMVLIMISLMLMLMIIAMILISPLN